MFRLLQLRVCWLRWQFQSYIQLPYNRLQWCGKCTVENEKPAWSGQSPLPISHHFTKISFSTEKVCLSLQENQLGVVAMTKVSWIWAMVWGVGGPTTAPTCCLPCQPCANCPHSLPQAPQGQPLHHCNHVQPLTTSQAVLNYAPFV